MPPGAEFAWAAFSRLHHDRPMTLLLDIAPAGMGGVTIYAPGPIPFSAIDCYARRYGYEEGQFELLCLLINRMDSAYISWRIDSVRKQVEQRAAQQRAGSRHG